MTSKQQEYLKRKAENKPVEEPEAKEQMSNSDGDANNDNPKGCAYGIISRTEYLFVWEQSLADSCLAGRGREAVKMGRRRVTSKIRRWSSSTKWRKRRVSRLFQVTAARVMCATHVSTN